MDNITHSLSGLFLSRAGLNQYSSRAGWILFFAVNAPDVDAFSSLKGSVAYLHYHRYLTHSVACLPLVAIVPLLIVWAISRRAIEWRREYPLALIGVASHLALDSTNQYGIRLALPFSQHWYRLDITNVVDIWIWAVFLLAIAGPFVSRLVASEIGAPRKHPGRGFAIFALVVVVLFDGARFVLHQRALQILNARVYSGESPSRVAAMPVAFNPFHWRGIVETPAFYSLHAVNVLAEFNPNDGRAFFKPEPVPAVTEAIAAARATPPFQEFERFSSYPFWRVTPVPEGQKVELLDMRFGDPSAIGFHAGAILDANFRVEEAWFKFGPRESK